MGNADELVFRTAAKERTDEDSTVTFTLDDVELVAHRPKDELLMILGSISSKRMQPGDQVWTFLDFCDRIFDKESADHIEKRLKDNDDDFGFAELTEIIEGLLERWSGRPSGSPPGSSPGRRKTSRRSTASSG